MTSDRPGALHGVKVLEIAQVMAIPICGTMLSDMGADVVKLEPPWGDASRYTMLPVLPGESKSFAVLNRGKRSVCLDLADERSRPALEALVRWADVVLVSAKGEDVQRYRMGYDHLRDLNPKMVYLEHVPIGYKGPMGGLGSYDLVAAGLSGLTGLIGKERNGQPQYTQPAMLDAGTGYLSAMAVCAALFARATTGEGQRIESSLLATGMAVEVNVTHDFAIDADTRAEYLAKLAEARKRGASYAELQQLRDDVIRRAAKGNIYYRYYRTKDAFLSVGCLSPNLQAKLRDALGVSDPRRESDFDARNAADRERLVEFVSSVEELIQTRTTDEWVELLRGYKIPCGPVLFPEEAINEPQVLENEYMIELEHEILGPYRTYAPPVRMDATPTRARGPSPPLGAHTSEVLREAGVTPDDAQALIDTGVAGGKVLER